VSIYVYAHVIADRNHFEEYARYCSELANEAATSESRQRLLKMAAEYMHAAELMRRRTSAPSPGARKQVTGARRYTVG
jgi:hypothetical protein